MRALLFALVLAAVLSAPTLADLPPGVARIQVTAVPARVHQLSPEVTSTLYYVYNRPSYTGRIGTAIALCEHAQAKWDMCQMYVRLGQGTVLTGGMFPRAATFRLYGVTGGTGLYTNVGGQMIQQPVGQGTSSLILTIQLEAF